MKKINYFIATFSLILILSACNTDFLDLKPADKLSAGNVWEDPGLIQLYMNDMYRRIGHGYSICPLSCFVDEAVFTPNWGAEDFNNCLLSPDNLYYWASDPVVNLMQWNELFKSVRNVNTFFENYDPSVVSWEVQAKRFKGEAFFFRAYYYHWLTFLYGGVPIIEKVYGLGDDYSVARNTFEECVDYIITSCDSAIQLLPENYNEDATNKGRATKGAAMALKARTLLYAASELYNNTSWSGGYAHPELIGFEGGDRTARWQSAKEAAQAIIETGWYSLYEPEPAATDSVALNFIDLFTSTSSTEDIFLRYFTLTDQGYEWNEYNPGKFFGPNGYHNWGNNTPTLQLVDAYEMKDGSDFDWDNPIHAAAPFSNRDPRFYATILYHGAKWRQRTADVMASDPIGLIDTKIYEAYKVDPNNVDTIEIRYGIDTRKSPYEDWNGTYTGFYMRKFIVEALDGQYTIQEVPWRFYRYTEVLMNYAEACIELGEDDEARTYINMIRTRAGMPEIASSVTGDELRQKYRNERRIELAFENQRFFDVRRWMIASEAYQTVKGLETYIPMVGHTADNQTIAGTPEYTTYESTPHMRTWDDKAYFFPIWRDEMNKNLLLIQNPYYE